MKERKKNVHITTNCHALPGAPELEALSLQMRLAIQRNLDALSESNPIERKLMSKGERHTMGGSYISCSQSTSRDR